MEKLRRWEKIDYSLFEGDEDKTRLAKYGLPGDVKFCKKCVISNQRPNSSVETSVDKNQKKMSIHFGDDGVCDACKVVEDKKKIDWKAREEELFALCEEYRKMDGSYDCIVPGSGGKDSIYTSYLLRYKYGMHPLTVTWSPHIYSELGYSNFRAWIESGNDNCLITPNIRTHRLLTRLSLEILLHPFQPFIIGQKNIAPKIAAKLGIPLIFYGENGAEYGNPRKNNDFAQMNNDFFSMTEKRNIMIGGVSYRELMDDFKIDASDLEIYMPVEKDELEQKEIRMYYLGYFEKWHPQKVYEFACDHSKFHGAESRSVGTYQSYASLDDKIDDLHHYTTYIKFGIGRASYDASQDIREGDISREEGIEYVKKYDGEWPERYMDELMEYLSIPEDEFPKASKMFEQPMMDREYFRHLCDRFRSPHLWKYKDGVWSLRKAVYR